MKSHLCLSFDMLFTLRIIDWITVGAKKRTVLVLRVINQILEERMKLMLKTKKKDWNHSLWNYWLSLQMLLYYFSSFSRFVQTPTHFSSFYRFPHFLCWVFIFFSLSLSFTSIFVIDLLPFYFPRFTRVCDMIQSRKKKFFSVSSSFQDSRLLLKDVWEKNTNASRQQQPWWKKKKK